jgi:energy-coupling factor transport system permease protein
MKAQQARGADFDTGSIFRRAKALIPIFVPLIIGAFRMASDLAMAMEARCYRGGEGRTKLHVFNWKRYDTLAVIIFCGFIALILLERFINLQGMLTTWLFG